jgi:hypothetical protein
MTLSSRPQVDVLATSFGEGAPGRVLKVRLSDTRVDAWIC